MKAKTEERRMNEIDATDSTLMKSLMKVMAVGSGLAGLQRPGDAAVLSHAPEMNGHQESGRERNDHAVQHIEAQQRGRADRFPGYERKSGIVTGMNERHVS